jgi:hypothetical protein
MPERESSHHPGRAAVSEPFHLREPRIIGRLRARALRLFARSSEFILSHRGRNERRRMAGVIGVADDRILCGLSELGYRRETVQLIWLAPLLHVAWIDGYVTFKESEVIFKAARCCRIDCEKQAGEQLIRWFDERPAPEGFDKTLSLITALLQTLPPGAREERRQDLISFCRRVAEASRGSLGLTSRVSWKEEAVLDQIAAALGYSQPGTATLMAS